MPCPRRTTMTPMRPAQESYPRLSGPHPAWAGFHRPGEGPRAHRAWTGTHKHRARRRWTACGRACSAREGTVWARSKLPADTVVRRWQGPRGGVGDEGPADRWAVALTTVPRLPRGAAPRAEPPQRPGVRAGAVPGVEWEEAPAKRRPPQGAWLPTAWALGRWLRLWGDVGPRTQEPAVALVAQVVARGRAGPLWLTAGWKAESAAWLQVLGGALGADVGGRWGASPNPGSSRPTTWSAPRWCRSAPRQGRWERGAGASYAAGPAAWGRRGASEPSAQRSRPPAGSAGMGPCAGWSPPGGA